MYKNIRKEIYEESKKKFTANFYINIENGRRLKYEYMEYIKDENFKVGILKYLWSIKYIILI